MNQRDIENGMSKLDALDTEGGDVAALLRALPRAEAPKNFEFGVKAKIAEGSAPRASIIPFWKAAAPLGLVLVVGAFVVFYGTLPSGNEIPASPESVRNESHVTQPPSEPSTPQRETVPVPQIIESVGVPPERASSSSTERSGPVHRTNNSAVDNRSQGGSIDQILRSAPVRVAPGFESANPRNRNFNTNANSGAAEVSLSDVLRMLAIEADFADGGWKVRSTSSNGSGQRAGVRAGDVIVAIDGTSLMQSTTFSGPLNVTTLRVRRDGKTIDLNLKN